MTSMYGVMGSTSYEIFIELVGREEEKETCVWTSQVPSLGAPFLSFISIDTSGELGAN